jgi:hypothetical protein
MTPNALCEKDIEKTNASFPEEEKKDAVRDA